MIRALRMEGCNLLDTQHPIPWKLGGDAGSLSELVAKLRDPKDMYRNMVLAADGFVCDVRNASAGVETVHLGVEALRREIGSTTVDTVHYYNESYAHKSAPEASTTPE